VQGEIGSVSAAKRKGWTVDRALYFTKRERRGDIRRWKLRKSREEWGGVNEGETVVGQD